MAETVAPPVAGPRATDRAWSPGAEAFAVAALTAVALALRVAQIRQSMFGDELFAYDEVAGRSFGGMLDAVLHGPEVTPPAYFVLAWISAQLGDPTVWMRLPSLLAGVALVPLTYALGTLTAGRRAAVLAAALVALWPHAIFYSVEARPYALLACAVAASTVCLLRALETRRTGWWVAYGALSLLAVGTHLTAIFVLGAQAIWALVAHRDAIRPLLIANAVAGLLFLPWLPRLRRDDVGWLLNLYGGFDPSPSEFADEVAHLLTGYPFAALGDIPTVPAAAAFLVAVGAAVAAAAWALWRRPGRMAALDALIVLLPLAVVAGLFANSALSDRDLVSTRNMISATPYVAVLVGRLVMRLRRPVAPALAAVLICAVALGAILALGDAGQRPRYRDAAAYIEREARPGDVVLERLLFPAFGEFGRPLTRHLAIYLPAGLRHLSSDADAQAERAATASGGRILLVQPSPFSTVGVPRALDGGAYRLTGRKVFRGIHPVAVATYER